MEKKPMAMPALEYWTTWNVGLILLGAAVAAMIAAYGAANQALDAAESKRLAVKATEQLLEVNAGVRRVESSLGLPAGSTVDQITTKILENQEAARLREADRDDRAALQAQTHEERRAAELAEGAADRELARRWQLVRHLTAQWVEEKGDGIPGPILMGLEFPPLDWMNARLAKAGEQFRLKSTDPLTAMPPVKNP